MPNWQFDTICVAHSLAEGVAAKFDLDLRPVGWYPTSPGEAYSARS